MDADLGIKQDGLGAVRQEFNFHTIFLMVMMPYAIIFVINKCQINIRIPLSLILYPYSVVLCIASSRPAVYCYKKWKRICHETLKFATELL
jgi:hypothetical protein